MGEYRQDDVDAAEGRSRLALVLTTTSHIHALTKQRWQVVATGVHGSSGCYRYREAIDPRCECIFIVSGLDPDKSDVLLFLPTLAILRPSSDHFFRLFSCVLAFSLQTRSVLIQCILRLLTTRKSSEYSVCAVCPAQSMMRIFRHCNTILIQLALFAA